MAITEDKTKGQGDGRLNRSTRTRAAIVQAMYELVGEGNAAPTSEDVAERASVGLRTVFRHFEDMDTLYQEVDQVIKERVIPQFDLETLTGSLEDRARKLIERREGIFQTVKPYMACTIARKWKSPYLARSYDAFAEIQRAFLFNNLPELKELPIELQHAADQIASFEVWMRMKDVLKLSAEEIVDAQTAGILAIIRGA